MYVPATKVHILPGSSVECDVQVANAQRAASSRESWVATTVLPQGHGYRQRYAAYRHITTAMVTDVGTEKISQS